MAIVTRNQPQGLIRLDRKNKFAQRALLVFTGSARADQVSTKTATNSGTAIVVGTNGLAVRVDTNTGSSNYLDFGVLAAIDSPFTVMVRVKANNVSSSRYDSIAGSVNTNNYFGFLVEPGGNRPYFETSRSGNTLGTSVSSLAALSTSAYEILLATFDGANLNLYRNGLLVSSVTTSLYCYPGDSSTTPVRIGADSRGNTGLACDVSDFCVFSTAFSAAEAAEFSNAPNQIYQAPQRLQLKSSGATTPTAALAWLEQNDTTAITGTFTAPLTASLAWTEANDVTAITGSVKNAASLAWIEANDVTAIQAAVVGTAALAWTETSDTTAIAATVTNAAALAWAESNDTTAIAGSVSTGGAVLNWTEQSDVTAIVAKVTNAGAASWTEASDVTAITASVLNTTTGALSWTEQNDTCAIIAAAVVNGGLGWTEQSDITAISAQYAQLVSGMLAWTEQNDTGPSTASLTVCSTAVMSNAPINSFGVMNGSAGATALMSAGPLNSLAVMSNAPLNQIASFL